MHNKFIKVVLYDIFSIMTYRKNHYFTLVRCIADTLSHNKYSYQKLIDLYDKDIDEFLEKYAKNSVFNYSMYYKKTKKDFLIYKPEIFNKEQSKYLHYLLNKVVNYKNKIKEDLHEKIVNSKKNNTIKAYYANLYSRGKKVRSKEDYKWNLKNTKKKQ